MLEANGTFFMVFSYTYDGEHGWNDPVFPASDFSLALEYLRKQKEENDAFYWNDERSLRVNLPGQYDYKELYIEEMTMNKEI